MSLYKRILVPVDGSATSMKGLREALRIARAEGAKVWVLHVLDEFFALSDPESARYADVLIASFKRGGERVLARASALAKSKGVKAQTLMPEIVGGPAAAEIVRQGKKVRADLIVLGTHGRKGVKRLALGSDAESVVRSSTVPVLLVRG
ncbi:MAG TPA: universal stress protein [Burkholderiales bacterium]|nr:universal stress protein [Burkholderiales bacterium]